MEKYNHCTFFKIGVVIMRKLSILFMLTGIAFILFGGYQIWYKTKKQNKSLAEAKELIQAHDSHRQYNKDIKDSEGPEDDQPSVPIDFQPETGDTVGLLNIPKLEATLPIIEGTDEEELEHGVGHYKGTAYPLQEDQIVLSGHRDTVFRGMGELELGDILTVAMPYGTFSYEITDFNIVSADDRTVIAPTSPNEVLTVTTCYPFRYIGDAPDRYIITAIPIDE